MLRSTAAYYCCILPTLKYNNMYLTPMLVVTIGTYSYATLPVFNLDPLDPVLWRYRRNQLPYVLLMSF